LLTELQYTLGQIHVQVGDLDAETRSSATCGDRTIDDILAAMMRSEGEYQSSYAQLLKTDISTIASNQPEVPLPINEEEADAENSARSDFEHERARTIALLTTAGETWPLELLAAVQQQVQEDRRHTTDLAECRKQYMQTDDRAQLDEPLTEHPTPHQFEDQAVASS